MTNDEARNNAKGRMTNEFVFCRSSVTAHFCFVLHFSPFSKFWKRSDAVPLLQSRGFEPAVLAPARLEQSCEENAWSRVVMRFVTASCGIVFTKSITASPNRAVRSSKSYTTPLSLASSRTTDGTWLFQNTLSDASCASSDFVIPSPF